MENGNQIAQNFLDVVNATERLTSPYRKLCIVLAIVLVITNMIWGGLMLYFIKQAYTDSIIMAQGQDFGEQEQNQEYRVGATDSD